MHPVLYFYFNTNSFLFFSWAPLLALLTAQPGAGPSNCHSLLTVILCNQALHCHLPREGGRRGATHIGICNISVSKKKLSSLCHLFRIIYSVFKQLWIANHQPNWPHWLPNLPYPILTSIKTWQTDYQTWLRKCHVHLVYLNVANISQA